MQPEPQLPSLIHPCEREQEAPGGPRWSARPRLIGLLIAGPLWVVLLVALRLTPSPAGYGTHRQLHLPPCGFLQTTGLPCPTCGMTTAFANLAHGHVLAALRAQAFAAVLFALVLAAALAGAIQALTGRDLLGRVRWRGWALWALLTALTASWALKLAFGLATGALPVR